MLYFLIGDRFDSINKIKDIVHKKKDKCVEYITLTDEQQEENIEIYLYSRSMLHHKKIIFCDEIKGNLFDSLLSNLKECQNSKVLVLVYSEKLDAKTLKQLKKNDIKIVEKKKKEEKHKKSSGFLFLEVFFRGDKSKSFAQLHKCLTNGEEPISLINLLRWQLRSILLVKLTRCQGETGLKDYPYKNSKRLAGTVELRTIKNKLFLLEKLVREGRLRRLTDVEILDRLVLTL